MASRIFLDANILLDLTLQREFYSDAKKLMEKIIMGELKAYMSPSVVHIVGYWLTKSFGATQAKEVILALLSDIEVIEIDHEVTVHALHSKIDDIEDALQYYTALHHKLDFFISRDKTLRKMSTSALPVYTPEAFLKTLK